MLASLGLLAALSVMASEAPMAVAAVMAVAATATGLALAGRELRRPHLHLVWTPRRGLAVDGRPVAAQHLSWRGRLAFVEWRDHDGCRRRVSWWPDTLDRAARRELRLAVLAASPSTGAASMAP